MAGINKDFETQEIHQGPGELWVIGTPPTDSAVRLTLASDGTPDSVTHGACVHLGAIQSAITSVAKPKIEAIDLDQFDSPIDGYVSDLEARIEAEMAQTEMQKLQRMIGVATYSSGSGFKQITFGGTVVVPSACVAAISPKRSAPNRHIVSVLYKAAAVGGIQLTMGRTKPSTYKCAFLGLADPARTPGRQVGVVYETLADAVGGTPSAKDFQVAEIYQGPGDLWLIDPAPADANPRVTLDVATLTPDSVAHVNAKHMGGTAGEISVTVTPKIEPIRMDQFDAPIDVFVQVLEAKIEAEMTQSAVEKLSRVLGVGTYTLTPGDHAQTTFGGTNQPASFCVAAIARKRTAPDKAVVACLFKVNSIEGISITMSRRKGSTYKVTFTGLVDPTRSAGKQIGIVHETV